MYRTTPLPTSGQSTVRAARGIAVVAGTQVRFEEFSVELNGFNAADTFTLRCPFFVMDSANDPVLAIDPNVASLLVNQDLVAVQLYVGYPSNLSNYSTSDLTKIMDGTMDTARWQFSLGGGETVTLNGRNQTGALIDTKIMMKYPNTPGSQLAQQYANEHGMTAEITQSPQYAGVYSNQETTLLSNKMSEWDLLLFMAKRDQFICRVKGGTLYYGPYKTVVGEDTGAVANSSEVSLSGLLGAPQNFFTGGSSASSASSTTSGPLTLTYGVNIESLDIERSPQAARDIQVTVLSYNRDGKTRIKATASSNTEVAAKIKGQLGQHAKYNIVKQYAGLTQAQANAKAKQLLATYSAKQVIGNLTTAGIVGLTIDQQFTLAGVGAGLAQSYYVNKVVHRMSLTDGYKTEVGFSRQTDYTAADLSNSSPDGQTGTNAFNSGPISGNVGTWINQALQAMAASGMNVSNINPSDLNIIIQGESSGNPNAINLTDSNAQAGHPSQGLMQTIPSTFSSYALSGYNTNIDDPVSSIIAGTRYAIATYGSVGNVPGVVAVKAGRPYVGY